MKIERSTVSQVEGRSPETKVPKETGNSQQRRRPGEKSDPTHRPSAGATSDQADGSLLGVSWWRHQETVCGEQDRCRETVSLLFHRHSDFLLYSF